MSKTITINSAEVDRIAVDIVRNYLFNGQECIEDFDIFIVWKCKTLQNWKYLISTTIEDGMYYELTYNGDKSEWYLDAYHKVENKVIPM